MAYYPSVQLNRVRSVPDLCTRAGQALDRLDMRTFVKTAKAVVRESEKADEAALTEGLVRLGPALERVAIGNGGTLADVVAALVEAGADPLPILDMLVERITDGLEQAARCPALAAVMGGELTAPACPAEANALLRRTQAAAARSGINADDSGVIMQAWFTVNDWLPALLVPLQHKRVRKALPQRSRLTDAAAAMTDHADDARWLVGLLQVLDDEPLIVIHRATGAAYQITISGIGDNFQLHTLLAATLIGDPADGLIPGQRPHRTWIAAAIDEDMTPPTPIRGQFNLVAADGAWIWNEGRPADIPVTSGRRVIVVDPPPYQRAWNIGRAYPLMTPQIHLDRVLPPDDSAVWVSRIAPRQTTDLTPGRSRPHRAIPEIG